MPEVWLRQGQLCFQSRAIDRCLVKGALGSTASSLLKTHLPGAARAGLPGGDISFHLPSNTDHAGTQQLDGRAVMEQEVQSSGKATLAIAKQLQQNKHLDKHKDCFIPDFYFHQLAAESMTWRTRRSARRGTPW